MPEVEYCRSEQEADSYIIPAAVLHLVPPGQYMKTNWPTCPPSPAQAYSDKVLVVTNGILIG